MIHFSNPNKPERERITIWQERHNDGFRLIERQPNGDLRTNQCPDRASLYSATVQLQAALTSSGWQPSPDKRTPQARYRTTRTGQFPR